MFRTDSYFRVAAYQGPILEKCPEKSIEFTLQALSFADENSIDVLTMPESFLHGYLDSFQEALKYSIDLQSSAFSDLCSQFRSYDATLLLGLNERSSDKIYNSAVVIEKGNFLGVYRKAYTYAPYDYFSLGQEFPVFERKGVKFGALICLDSVYLEPAKILDLKGAQILFCPMFNRIPFGSKMPYFMTQKNHFRARAFENNCWIVASDVVDTNNNSVAAGHACIVNSDGEIVSQTDPFTHNVLTYSIPIRKLSERKEKRVFGNPELFEIMKQTYYDRRRTL